MDKVKTEDDDVTPRYNQISSPAVGGSSPYERAGRGVSL